MASRSSRTRTPRRLIQRESGVRGGGCRGPVSRWNGGGCESGRKACCDGCVLWMDVYYDLCYWWIYLSVDYGGGYIGVRDCLSKKWATAGFISRDAGRHGTLGSSIMYRQSIQTNAIGRSAMQCDPTTDACMCKETKFKAILNVCARPGHTLVSFASSVGSLRNYKDSLARSLVRSLFHSNQVCFDRCS